MIRLIDSRVIVAVVKLTSYIDNEVFKHNCIIDTGSAQILNLLFYLYKLPFLIRAYTFFFLREGVISILIDSPFAGNSGNEWSLFTSQEFVEYTKLIFSSAGSFSFSW